MAITLSPDATKRLHESIKRYFAEHLYNQAIADAQKYFGARVLDLEGVCHEPEFSYWRSRG